MNPDLETAKTALENHTIALCKDGKTLTRDSRGVKPMIELIDDGIDLVGYSVADRVVGRAAALLFAYAGIKSVYAGVLSESGAAVLDEHGIPYECGTLVARIINRTGDGTCPMETATADINDPTEVLAAIKVKLKELGAK